MGLLAMFAGVIASTHFRQGGTAPVMAHSCEEFSFVVAAQYELAFPLFGANEERKWAAGFDPRFIYPSPARDQQGMVFITEQEGKERAWTNTAFDRATGHVQYVYFVKDLMVTMIDIRIARAGDQEARVGVVYERTALSPEANEYVRELAIEDANSGPKWAKAINGYLANLRSDTSSTAEPIGVTNRGEMRNATTSWTEDAHTEVREKSK